jgi:hypothetical protein
MNDVLPANDDLQTDDTVMTNTARYARAIKVSKRVRWDIDADIIRGRDFDDTRTFLPSGLSRVDDLEFLSATERRLMSQVQGRTYAYMFGLVERFIGAKVLQRSGQHWLGDQTALEALVRFSDEELKHQELFRRLEKLMAAGMPGGYTFVPSPNEVATAVLSKSSWAVLGLTCNIELFTLDHYRQSIDKDPDASELWKDVFLFHMKEESQHAILDELEWQRENAQLNAGERDAAVNDLIALVAAVDGILHVQSAADAEYFVKNCGRALKAPEEHALRTGLLRAYRWQYIASGTKNERFMSILGAMLTPEQMQRVVKALAPILDDAGALQ